MARIAGRNGALLIALDTASTAYTTISFLRDWSISFTSDQIDVTSMADSNKVYVGGLSDATGSVSGFLDAATTNNTFEAALDGESRSFKLYPDAATTTSFYSGAAIWDFSLTSAVDGAVEFSANFSATSAITRTFS
jgi:predicted secreted protein